MAKDIFPQGLYELVRYLCLTSVKHPVGTTQRNSIHVTASQVTFPTGCLEGFAAVYDAMVIEDDAAATFQSEAVYESLILR